MSIQSRSQCRAELEARLTCSCDPKLALHLSVRDDVLVEVAGDEQSSEEPHGLLVGPPLVAGAWALRNEDVKLLETLTAGVTSTTTMSVAGFVLGGAVVTPVVAVSAIVNALVFFRRIRKMSVAINETQFQVLRGLKKSRTGMTVEDVEGWLAWAKPDAEPGVAEETLRSLENIRRNDGTTIRLANSDSCGRWSSCDI